MRTGAVRVGAVAAVLSVTGLAGLAGCGDDGDRTTGAPEPSVEAWCAAFDETQAAGIDPEDNVAFDLLVDVAPGDIREASEVLRDVSLGQPDPDADVTAADAEVRAYAGTHCD